jgi:hypothetical protein
VLKLDLNPIKYELTLDAELCDLIKRNYNRHTLGWTVRGHWRTYKSGKKTWIKPSVRGDKDKITGKIYEV